MTKTTKNPLSTSATQAAIIVGQGTIVAVKSVGLTSKAADVAPVLIDAVLPDSYEYATRANSLYAAILALEAVDVMHSNFYSLAVPGVVHNAWKNGEAVRYIQTYKKIIAGEAKLAEKENREARKFSMIKVPVFNRETKKQEFVKISTAEIELWVEFFQLLGEKPFVSLSNSRYAHKLFRDSRSSKMVIAKSEVYDFLRAHGADIKDTGADKETEEETVTEEVFSIAAGAGKRRAGFVEITEEEDAV